MKSLLLPVGSWLRAVGLALLPLASAWAGSVQVEVRDAAADKPLDQAVVYLELNPEVRGAEVTQTWVRVP